MVPLSACAIGIGGGHGSNQAQRQGEQDGPASANGEHGGLPGGGRPRATLILVAGESGVNGPDVLFPDPRVLVQDALAATRLLLGEAVAMQSARVPAARVLIVASFGAFLAFLDATIVNVAFPSIRESFPGTSIGGLSWVLNAYNIVLRGLPDRLRTPDRPAGPTPGLRHRCRCCSLSRPACAQPLRRSSLLVAARVLQAARGRPAGARVAGPGRRGVPRGAAGARHRAVGGDCCCRGRPRPPARRCPRAAGWLAVGLPGQPALRGDGVVGGPRPAGREPIPRHPYASGPPRRRPPGRRPGCAQPRHHQGQRLGVGQRRGTRCLRGSGRCCWACSCSAPGLTARRCWTPHCYGSPPSASPRSQPCWRASGSTPIC